VFSAEIWHTEALSAVYITTTFIVHNAFMCIKLHETGEFGKICLSSHQACTPTLSGLCHEICDCRVVKVKVRAGVSQRTIVSLDNRIRTPTEAKDFSSNLCVQTGPGAHPTSCRVGTGGKGRPGCDADHSPPSSAEVKDEQKTSPPPPRALQQRIWEHV
jgi:hypothetical protein